MSYIFKPSLQYMTNIQIIATLCNQSDVKNLLSKLYVQSHYSNFNSRLQKIEAIVVEKVAKLPLPKLIKKELLCLIRPVVLHISNWKEFHYHIYKIKVDLPNEFYWTPQGTIDKKKTAEMLIEDESIDITTRYKLACINCLEDDIKKLWDKIPEGCRKSFYSEEDPMHIKQNELVVFWTYHQKGEMIKMESRIEKQMDRRCSPYQYAFDLAAFCGNKVAIQHFLQKLTSTEREQSLVKAIHIPFRYLFESFKVSFDYFREMSSHNVSFLLSELNEEQQAEVFKTIPHLVLLYFLHWPLQIFFMETANRVWNLLEKNFYVELLIEIINKIKHDYNDFDYQMLFREFWEQSPHDYKSYVLSHDIFYRIVPELLQIRNEDNIKLVFKDVTPEDKKYLIYDIYKGDTCMELMNGDQLSLLKYFIKECLPSKEEVIKFKEDFKNGELWHVTEYLISNWQQKFLCVLEDVICEFNFNKRICEDHDSSKAKKVCREEFSDVAHSADK